MQPSTLLSMGLLAFTATAQRAIWNDGDKFVNQCGQTIFSATKSKALTQDCTRIADNLSKEPRGGAFMDSLSSYIAIKTEGSCTFAVKAERNGGFFMGRDDIIDVIHDSVAKYNKDGKVGAEGNMRCGKMNVSWRIHENGGPV